MNTPTTNITVQTSKILINLANLPEIELVEHELTKCFNNLKSPMKEMCHYIINSGGKRLRPLLLFYSGKCLGALTDSMIKAATAAELIHLASLVHDDIIDGSDLRHKKVTLNSTYGKHISVLVGDYLFAKAFEVLCSNKIYAGMESMVEAIQDMCEGEILQASEIENPSFSLEGYYKRIEKKTAKLLSSCCKTGASLASLNDASIESMQQYGLNLGYAFQIIDDILDVIGDTNELGKPVFNDLIQGNVTLPILFLMQHEVYFLYVNRILNEKIAPREFEADIKIGLYQTGALEQAYLKALEYCTAAKLCLNDIPDSPFRQTLLALPDKILSRCN